MTISKKIIALFVVTSLAFASSDIITDKDIYTVKGRTEVLADKSIALIGSASSVTFGFKGSKCIINLQAKDDHHNYVSVAVDGEYYTRFKILPKGTAANIMVTKSGPHIVTVYKATEASNGVVVFKGAEGAPLYKAAEKPKKKIEFIGDSITCGYGNDLSDIPCDGGVWFDQHNAYYSYAPITARTLGADFVLSSVSGIGMYRNWNDEHDTEAIMPDVYENLYLNKDNSKPYSFGYNPDVTCIALGTNDFSDGDGKKARLPFNEKKYIDNYVAFIQTVYNHAPNTQIVLLNSPMVSGAKNDIYTRCLNTVKEKINAQKTHKPVTIFLFTGVTPHGCGYHPEIEDDKLMASQLAPYLKTLLK